MNPENVSSGAGDPFVNPGFPHGASVQPGAPTSYPVPYSSGGAAYPYSRLAPPFSSAYGGAYSAGYGSVYGAGGGTASNPFTPFGSSVGGRYGALVGGAQQAQAGGAAVLSSMQEAMQRFARVSSLMEDVLRNLHVLFDGVFGLGYSLGAFHDEARMWFAVKSGPVAFVSRAFSKLARLWRLVVVFLCSPLAGEFSPVALVLQVLGVAPVGDALDSSEQRGVGWNDVPLEEEGWGTRASVTEAPRSTSNL